MPVQSGFSLLKLISLHFPQKSLVDPENDVINKRMAKNSHSPGIELKSDLFFGTEDQKLLISEFRA